MCEGVSYLAIFLNFSAILAEFEFLHVFFIYVQNNAKSSSLLCVLEWKLFISRVFHYLLAGYFG